MQPETLDKSYEPAAVEARWYKFWEDNGLFHADPHSDKPPYSLVIPPPNVTGALHMGHALNNTLQDVLCRFKRLTGYEVLWMPGTDHAGIATQNVVERQLASEDLTRHDLGRDKFIERVWQWREEYGGRIINQLKRLGASCDWQRERFTMDEGLSRAVREVFVRLWEEGLVYQGDYIINWCPRCHTALSDLESEHEDVKGGLYHIRYPFKNGKGHLVVATTRPETLLGDTAVAVNPEDPRYQDLPDDTLLLPLLGRELPIIRDEYVSLDFGTGALKVTPAHDPHDFDLGLKHGLEAIRIMDDNGAINAQGGPYEGLDRFEARKKVLADLEAQGLLEKQEEHLHSVGHCYRYRTMVEPILSKQWFVKVGPLAEEALKAVQTGGPSGGCVPAEHLDTPVDFDELTKLGSMMGSGGMIIMDEDTCMVDVARYFINFLTDESCGKCVPCREGLRQMLKILTRITEGKGEEGDIETLEDLSFTAKEAALCALGKSAPNPFLSTLNYFRDEYEAHIKDKRCPARSCKALIDFHIDPAKCQACMICAKKCPAEAIEGGKNKIHVIDQDKCTKCGTCFEVCPPRFQAVQKTSGEPVPPPIPEEERTIVRKSKKK